MKRTVEVNQELIRTAIDFLSMVLIIVFLWGRV
jgi:hypothetical protein